MYFNLKGTTDLMLNSVEAHDWEMSHHTKVQLKIAKSDRPITLNCIELPSTRDNLIVNLSKSSTKLYNGVSWL